MSMQNEPKAPPQKTDKSLYEMTVTIRLRTWARSSDFAEEEAHRLVNDRMGNRLMDEPAIAVERVVTP